MEFGYPIEHLLSDIRRFMLEFPSEIVLVEADHLDGAPSGGDDFELAKMLIHYLGDFMYPRESSLDLTISEMVSQNKRAVVSLDCGTVDAFPQLWKGWDTIYNTYADQCDLSKMEDYNVDAQKKFEEGKWDG